MNVLTIVIIVFIVIETFNIIMLYFFPGAKKGNGMGVFDAYEKSKEIPELHSLIRYLINWVAGTKLIFVALLIVIVITGDSLTRLLSAVVMIPSIATFYWRLYPLILKMDKAGNISPKGYSKTLFLMINFFILCFAAAVIFTILNSGVVN